MPKPAAVFFCTRGPRKSRVMLWWFACDKQAEPAWALCTWMCAPTLPPTSQCCGHATGQVLLSICRMQVSGLQTMEAALCFAAHFVGIAGVHCTAHTV